MKFSIERNSGAGCRRAKPVAWRWPRTFSRSSGNPEKLICADPVEKMGGQEHLGFPPLDIELQQVDPRVVAQKVVERHGARPRSSAPRG